MINGLYVCPLTTGNCHCSHTKPHSWYEGCMCDELPYDIDIDELDDHMCNAGVIPQTCISVRKKQIEVNNFEL